jgi:hypothetical protein
MNNESAEKRIIEINGIKMEIDLRHAKRVDTFKVGDKVRVLVKSYGDTFNTYAGMIVGFDNFKERPTIIVAYIEPGAYSADPLKFVNINQDTKDVEITAMSDDFIAADKSSIIDRMDKIILDHQQKIQEMEARKSYFLKYFDAYFTGKEAPIDPETEEK